MNKTEVFRILGKQLLLTSVWDFYIDFKLTKSNTEVPKTNHDLFVIIYLN
jgi:hypothetical protein